MLSNSELAARIASSIASHHPRHPGQCSAALHDNHRTVNSSPYPEGHPNLLHTCISDSKLHQSNTDRDTQDSIIVAFRGCTMWQSPVDPTITSVAMQYVIDVLNFGVLLLSSRAYGISLRNYGMRCTMTVASQTCSHSQMIIQNAKMRPKTSGSHRNPVDTSFRDAALSISGRSKDTTFQVQGVSYDLQFVLLSISISNTPERCFQGLAIVTTIVLKRYIDGA